MIDSSLAVSAKSIEAFWRAANYVSVCLLYLRSNAMLSRKLLLSDVKPRIIGHWGCVPSLNFVWANLLSAIRVTGADVRLFFGTGHAGASWLACSYIEGSLSGRSGIGDDEVSLANFAASFGRTSGYTTELSVQYPGVLWSSGELGYTLGIAHGHSLTSGKGAVVVVLGDGELETAPTSAAFHGIRKFIQYPSRLTIIVNLNGLRMGGPSEISTWTDQEIRDYFVVLGLDPLFVEGFDARALSAALANGITNDHPQLILLRTPKGATMPGTRQGEDLAGTILSHKVPTKKLQETDVAWLDAWLRSYNPERIFKNGRFDRSCFASILPRSELLIGTVRDRIVPATQRENSPRCLEYRQMSGVNVIEAFVKAVGYLAEHASIDILLTSPDELASNRLTGIQSRKVEIIEYLSEHQCLSWSIGAVTAGRLSWYASYDAFAPIISSMVTQYLKFLDSAADAGTGILDEPLNIFLTSLGWRNVYSHQDPGFASSLLEKGFSSFRCFMPVSSASMVAAVETCHSTRNMVNCVIADKYAESRSGPASGLADGNPFALIGSWGMEGNADIEISFVVAGDYLVREATFAAEVVSIAAKHVRIQTIVLEELTWLYRSCAYSESHKRRFRRLVDKSDFLLLVTSLYANVLSDMISDVVPQQTSMTSRGYRSSLASVTPVGVLVESRSSWLQLAMEALDLTRNRIDQRDAKSVSSARNKLAIVEGRLRRDLAEAYDEPEWYWNLKPQDIFT